MKKYGIILIGFMAALSGCQSGNQMNALDLEVVEQIDTICGSHEENTNCWATFNIDVPVNGPQVLVDSVMELVNREVYKMCEYCIEFVDRPDEYVAYSQEEMFTHDGERLLNHYMEKYKPLIEDSLWNTFSLELKLEAQTEKCITYGMEFLHCGGGCGSEKYYFTFDKSDGHQVRSIISFENLAKFFKDYPEYNSIDWVNPWFGTEGGQLFYPEDGADNYEYGLLDDHFSLSIEGYGSHYLLLGIPYGQIFSYLSPEAQALVERHQENEPMLPAYLSHKNPEVDLEVDTVNYALIGCVGVAGGEIRDTLLHYDPALEIYPKLVYTIGSPVYLLTYSFGHLLYQDEVMTCTLDDNSHLRPVSLFSIEGKKDSVVTCTWYDQPLEASGGFPYDEFDENRFGLHYNWFTKRLYYPILESHDPDSEFANTSCSRYTGRFEVLQFNGKEFIPAGTDGAWWLNPDLRNYKRTISNKKSSDGIEQIDLMLDGTYRRAFWKGAKTLDDLRKKPDEVKISNQNKFKEY